MRQCYVFIEGRKTAYDLPGVPADCPAEAAGDCLRAEVKNGRLEGEGLKPGRGVLKLAGTELRFAVFREKEAFLIPVISCNYHEGWNPGIQNEVGHPQCCGPDMHGNGFNYALRLARLIHEAGCPITWLTDGYTYRCSKEELDAFSAAGDEIGFMPSSFSHYNSRNYNLFMGEYETFKLIEGQLNFLRHISGKEIRTAGIDQFIGAIGTNLQRAMTRLGITGLWGIGTDHKECDTSMFHYGCPWNPYKPSVKNFRIPGRTNTHPWIFDWTYRDLINTIHVPGISSGAVYFSTDVDDIFNSNIARNQPDYYNRIAEKLLANVPDNDFAVMLVHQEDHDSGDDERNEYLGRFFASAPAGFTRATIGEAADWLDIKYPGSAEPVQSLYLEDPLDCHEAVRFYTACSPKPADWPAAGEKYAPICAYYDADTQVIFEKGSNAPLRYFDYSLQPVCAENSYVEKINLPRIAVSSIKYENGCLEAVISAFGASQKYPLAVWTDKPVPKGAPGLKGGFFVFTELHEGENNIRIVFEE